MLIEIWNVTILEFLVGVIDDAIDGSLFHVSPVCRDSPLDLSTQVIVRKKKDSPVIVTTSIPSATLLAPSEALKQRKRTSGSLCYAIELKSTVLL